MRVTRDFYIPSEYDEKISFEDIKAEAYIYTNTLGKKALMIFTGGRSKPDLSYYYDSIENLKKSLWEFVDKLYKRVEYRKAQKQREKEEFENVKVGDLFIDSWGYDQTNVDAYQLIELKGKTGTFREVSQKSLKGTGNSMAEYRVAIKDDFMGEPFKKRIRGDSFKSSSFSWARKKAWNSKFYVSWYA